MRRTLVLALVAAAGLPGAAPGSPAVERTIGTRGSVGSISADNGRVAIRSLLEGAKQSCRYAAVWRPATNGVKRFEENSCVGRDDQEERHVALTLAGTRVAWADFEYGNHAYCQGVFTATVASPRPVELPSPCDPSEGVSDYYFHFSGDGGVLAYSSYLVCDVQCTDDNGETLPEGLYDVELRTVIGGRVRLVAAPPDRSLFVGVSGTTLLLFEQGRGFVVRALGGRLLRQFPIADTAFDAAYFSGSNVVLRRGATVAVHDAATFAKRATWPIRARRLDDVENDLATYRAGGRVRVLDLANGKDAAVATPKGRLVEAQLEPDGLYFAYNVAKGAKPGRVTFLPMATVRAALGR